MTVVINRWPVVSNTLEALFGASVLDTDVDTDTDTDTDADTDADTVSETWASESDEDGLEDWEKYVSSNRN